MNTLVSLLTGVADQFALQLVVWSLQAVALVTLTQILLRLLGASSSALRHDIWVLALLAIATLPVLSVVPLPTPQQQLSAIARSFVVPDPLKELAPWPEKKVLELTRPETLVVIDSLTKRFLPIALRVVFCAWVLGFGFLVSKLIFSEITIYLAYRSARPLEDAFATPGSRPEVPILLSEHVPSPLLYGLFHPVILLPADILEWTTTEELQSMVDHELAHVARRDPIANILQSFIQVTFFFHPVVRYACRQTTFAREMACDERVLSQGNRASVYAEGILKVAERCLGSHISQIALFSKKEVLERRIEMILNHNLARLPRTRRAQLVLPAAILVACAWLLVPGRPIVSEAASLGGSVGVQDPASLQSLYEMAARAPEPDSRSAILRRLSALEREPNSEAITKLYRIAVDPSVKRATVDSLARLEEIGALVTLGRDEKDADLRERILFRIRNLKLHSEKAEVRQASVGGLEDELNQIPDAPPPPPPPPPPPGKRSKVPPPPPPPPKPGAVREDITTVKPPPPPPPPPPPKPKENW